MVSAANTVTLQTGLLRSRRFDNTLVQGVAALAILPGLIVVAKPELLVDVVGIAAIASVIAWVYQRVRAWRNGRLLVTHT